MRLRLIETISGRVIPIGKLPALIGRDPSADVQLDDASLPPYQCMIAKEGSEELTVWNLREEFPVSVNGRFVAKATLRPGDTLTIGTGCYVVQYEMSRRRRFGRRQVEAKRGDGTERA
jgi:hypothetical protein